MAKKKKEIEQPNDLLNNMCSLFIYTRMVESYYKKQVGEDIDVHLYLDGVYLINEKEKTGDKIDWNIVEEKFPMPKVIKDIHFKCLLKNNL